MSRVRYDFSCTLRVKSPLHIGSGEFREIEKVLGKEGANARPLVAAIVRDCEGKPYIPGTALKNLCLRTARALLLDKRLDEDVVKGLFGTIKGDNQGAIGAVLFRGATLEAAGNATEMPYASGSTDLGPGVFVAARTRIDPATGTADDHKLFFQQMVAPEATFSFRMLLEGRNAAIAMQQADGLQGILDALTAGDGALGKGQADGFGRVSVVPGSRRVNYSVLDESGVFAPRDTKVEPSSHPRPASEPTAERWRLALTCDGPFMVVDSSWRPPKERDGTPMRTSDPQLKAQRIAANLPLLLGSSLSGALRARASWLVALAGMRGAGYAEGTLERLFGREEFRALLQIEQLDVVSAEPFEITSVKLDRFSGAPIDNALFKSATFRAVRIDVGLSLAVRPGEGTPTDDDRRLATSLIDDLKASGIELGHGGNKGFGWFEVEVAHADAR